MAGDVKYRVPDPSGHQTCLYYWVDNCTLNEACETVAGKWQLRQLQNCEQCIDALGNLTGCSGATSHSSRRSIGDMVRTFMPQLPAG
jgi:uncharacterized protein YerC